MGGGGRGEGCFAVVCLFLVLLLFLLGGGGGGRTSFLYSFVRYSFSNSVYFLFFLNLFGIFFNFIFKNLCHFRTCSCALYVFTLYDCKTVCALVSSSQRLLPFSCH